MALHMYHGHLAPMCNSILFQLRRTYEMLGKSYESGQGNIEEGLPDTEIAQLEEH